MSSQAKQPNDDQRDRNAYQERPIPSQAEGDEETIDRDLEEQEQKGR